MRRIFTGILMAMLLTGCAASAPGESGEAAPETGGREPEAELLLELEHETYDASLDRYTYFIRNGTEKPVEFGEAYLLQRWVSSPGADQWENLPLLENAGFESIGYVLAPGGTMALSCGFGLFGGEPEEGGRYRLVKEVDGRTLYGEFHIGDGPYTLEAPYGFVPLEELPEIYGAAEAAADGAVAFSGAGTENMGAAEEFLRKAGLGAPCQLRTVQDYGEGTPMVIDAIFENNHFLWRVRSGGEIMERRFAYLVTDGTDVYLSNGADWESTRRYDSGMAWLVPSGSGENLVSAAENMTAERLAGNAARCKVWSADGEWAAALTEAPGEFSVEYRGPTGSWGRTYRLRDCGGPEGEITGLSWQEDGALRLACETGVGGKTPLLFEPQSERITAGLCGLPRNSAD